MRPFFVCLLLAASAEAGEFFAGAMGGVATISADARTVGTPPAQFSAYKPQNGPSALAFGGRHFNNYFSAQLSYAWNRNNLVFSGADVLSGASYEQPGQATLHTVVAEAMVYFRPAKSRVRPYLSAGPGVTVLRAAVGPLLVRGTLPVPDGPVHSTRPSVRVAVGMDVRMGRNVWFRYSFCETIQRNPLSQALRPPAQRNLANFQNLWGVSWQF
ncbi:MAG: outer membrane beta-barrel protein [Acidobacteriota bacterium]